MKTNINIDNMDSKMDLFSFRAALSQSEKYFSNLVSEAGYHLVPMFSVRSKLYNKASGFETIFCPQNPTNVNVTNFKIFI